MTSNLPRARSDILSRLFPSRNRWLIILLGFRDNKHAESRTSMLRDVCAQHVGGSKPIIKCDCHVFHRFLVTKILTLARSKPTVSGNLINQVIEGTCKPRQLVRGCDTRLTFSQPRILGYIVGGNEDEPRITERIHVISEPSGRSHRDPITFGQPMIHER